MKLNLKGKNLLNRNEAKYTFFYLTLSVLNLISKVKLTLKKHENV